jgi:pSer/pThr/pTyr-binding forkhead associated (FHA) protein
MRLAVRHSGKKINELKFDTGPVYIGRQMGCQVFLPDRAVSRQHAVIYSAGKKKWVLEDLDSANKTFLNNKAIHKDEIGHGDVVRIGDFTIDVDMHYKSEEPGEKMQMDDTLLQSTTVSNKVQAVIRKTDSKHTPIIVPTNRLKDLADFSEMLYECQTLVGLHKSLMEILLRQFNAYEVWGAFRESEGGAVGIEGGRNSSGVHVVRENLTGLNAVEEALENNRYLFIPRVGKVGGHSKVRSVMAAPLLLGDRNFGAVYVDNSSNQQAYEQQDLDYLLIISIQTAGLLAGF